MRLDTCFPADSHWDMPGECSWVRDSPAARRMQDMRAPAVAARCIAELADTASADSGRDAVAADMVSAGFDSGAADSETDAVDSGMADSAGLATERNGTAAAVPCDQIRAGQAP